MERIKNLKMELGQLMKELDAIFESGELRENFGRIAELSGEIVKKSEKLKKETENHWLYDDFEETKKFFERMRG